MKVKCIRPFTARINGNGFHATVGQEFELPPGVDWLNAGFVEAIEQPPVKKTAVSQSAKGRSTRAKTNKNG